MSRRLRFIAGCPVQGCRNGNTPISWVHSIDHGPSFIYDDGNIECDKCLKRGLIIDWKFDCGDHDYEYASYQGFLNMLSVLGHLEADEDFVDNCLDAGRRLKRMFRGK